MSAEHLISDEETRHIAEGFLGVSPWLGDVEWVNDIVIGPNAEYLAGFDGKFPANAKLREDQKWSWRVSFSDPAGTKRTLSHEAVLKGLSDIVYGDHEGAEGFRYMRITEIELVVSSCRSDGQAGFGEAAVDEVAAVLDVP
ncbi:hypothetical protein ACH4A7_37655 [Streptomyces cyaneofuscatus]|uniref:hypothetical protein n=1 Tax=Streptomyces cyaneofuscatus TaxID=66883 RepID=UPI00379B478D